jgi:hypothetical protein
MADSITPAQLKKLQTLWGVHWRLNVQFAARPEDDPRAMRMAWLAANVGRAISSSKDLTMLEAERTILALVKLVPAQFNIEKKRIGRQRAQELGTAGRRGKKSASSVEVFAGPEELKHIYNLMQRIGWDRARLDEFLRGPRGPLLGRTHIRTLADANRVRWALKGILRSMQRKTPSSLSVHVEDSMHDPLALADPPHAS